MDPADPPPKPKFNRAPKKSISSLKSSFEIVVVPFASMAPKSAVTPAFLPSKTGSLSNAILKDTLGSL